MRYYRHYHPSWRKWRRFFWEPILFSQMEPYTLGQVLRWWLWWQKRTTFPSSFVVRLINSVMVSWSMDSAKMNWVSDHQPFHCALLIIRISKVPLTITRRNSNLKTVPSGQNLEILNPLYDLTPPTYITAVVTEVGLIPPSSISSIPLALGKTTL